MGKFCRILCSIKFQHGEQKFEVKSIMVFTNPQNQQKFLSSKYLGYTALTACKYVTTYSRMPLVQVVLPTVVCISEMSITTYA